MKNLTNYNQVSPLLFQKEVISLPCYFQEDIFELQYYLPCEEPEEMWRMLVSEVTCMVILYGLQFVIRKENKIV